MERNIPRKPEITLPLYLQLPFFEGLITYTRLKTGELQQNQSGAADNLISYIDIAANYDLLDTTAYLVATLGIIGRNLKKAPTIDDILNGNVTLDPTEQLPLYDIAEIDAREERKKPTIDWFLEQFLRHRKEREEGTYDPDENVDNF